MGSSTAKPILHFIEFETEATSGFAKGYYEYQAQARRRGRTIVFGGSWTLAIPKQQAPTL
jgi:hypothetical protein